MNFYVYAPSYNPNSGGCIALHKLVHIINSETEYKAYLVPRVVEKYRLESMRDYFRVVRNKIKLYLKRTQYKTNPAFNTPVVRKLSDIDTKTGVCVYPEITFGNPLKAQKVVRWFLHQPGHFTKEICYGTGELYFKFNSAIKDFQLYNSKLSPKELKVIHYPLEIYNKNTVDEKRAGICYMVRKGKHKAFIHPDGALCLDGCSHEEIAQAFKTHERFISYDDYTAYSLFSVLCGCESIVVPDELISIDEWYPNVKDRYGIAYGVSEEQLSWASETSEKVLELIKEEHYRSVKCVLDFINECDSFFSSHNDC